MPMLTVDYPKDSLTRAQKDQLAEEMTHVLLEIEGGQDTPGGRSISWVRFKAIEKDDWFIGGKSDDTYVAEAGKFLVELNVPEGSMNQERKSQAKRAIADAILRATGSEGTKGAARSIWVQIFEWPEGHMGTSGNTASLFGIVHIAGLPDDSPILDFSRAYFDAKQRLFDRHEFPEGAAGRALVPYREIEGSDA
jgi:phenylpyruvate tautomerase PptA (4-oxalocrotonate tautomerase family)